jgi:hypothetical protein
MCWWPRCRGHLTAVCFIVHWHPATCHSERPWWQTGTTLKIWADALKRFSRPRHTDRPSWRYSDCHFHTCLLFCLFIDKYGLFNDAGSSWDCMTKLHTAQYSLCAPESLWSEISYYVVFWFIGIFDIASQIAANKRWYYVGGFTLCTRRFFARSQNDEKQLFRYVCRSVIPSAWNNSAFSGRIFTKFDIEFFENLSRKLYLFYLRTKHGCYSEVTADRPSIRKKFCVWRIV